MVYFNNKNILFYSFPGMFFLKKGAKVYTFEIIVIPIGIKVTNYFKKVL